MRLPAAPLLPLLPLLHLLAFLALPALTILAAFTPRACPAQSARTLTVYDVRDILAVARDFPMHRFNAGQPKAQPEEAEARAAAHDAFVADLKRHLRQAGVSPSEFTIEPPHRGNASPRGIGGQSIEGMVILKATPTAHQAVVAYLNHRRALGQTIIHVEARIFRVQDPKRNLPRRLEDEPIGKQDLLFMLDAAQAKAMARDLGAHAKKKSSGITVLTAPGLAVFHGQRANVTISNQQAYVADFNLVKVLGGKTVVADPVVKTIEVGLGIEVRVEVAADEPTRARVEIAYQNAELERPIEEKRLEHGTIQIPKVTSVSLDFTVHLPLPGNLLLASRERPGRGVDLVLLHFERHVRDDLLKRRRAAVKAVGPVVRGDQGAQRVFYLGAGKKNGLSEGMSVRLMRRDPKERPVLAANGVVTRAYDDATEVTVSVPKPAPPVSAEDLVDWWAEWGRTPARAAGTGAGPKRR